MEVIKINKEKQNIEINPRKVLPDSIDIHPAMTIVDYQKLENIPELVMNEIKKERRKIL